MRGFELVQPGAGDPLDFNCSLLEGIKPVVLPTLNQPMRNEADPKHVYRLKLDDLTAFC